MSIHLQQVGLIKRVPVRQCCLFLDSAKSGIFEPLVKVGDSVDEGTPLAEIINPYDGSVMETLYAPRRGTLFFMHSDPITYAETAVIKMV